MYIIYNSHVDYKSKYLGNNILPEADRIADVFISKSAFPMVNKKLEPPFIVFSSDVMWWLHHHTHMQIA